MPSSKPCAYCGLPILDSRGGVYCCLGCQIADGIVRERSSSDGVSITAMRLGLSLFFSMNVMAFTLALWSWDTYAQEAGSAADTLRELLRWGCCVFATPVLLLLGKPLGRTVLEQFAMRHVTTDALLLLGVLAAYGYSVLSLVNDQPHVYFEVTCMLLLAVTLGRWFEAEGKQRAVQSLRTLQDMLPSSAAMVEPDGGTIETPLEEIPIGATIRVLPGARIPLDGVIQKGSAFVDERMVTGESQAIAKQVADRVFGGTLNLDGCLDLRVTADASEGTIPRLVEAVQDAASSSSPPQRLADRLARWMVPLVLAFSVLVFAWHARHDNLRDAWMALLSVTLIACPCALAIATPLAVWAGLSRAAAEGVVFRSSHALLTLARVDHLGVDKTGTLTDDAPVCVRHLVASGVTAAEVWQVAKDLAGQTRHPLAAAILQAAGNSPENSLDTRQESEAEPSPTPLPPTAPIPFGEGQTLPGQGVIAMRPVSDGRGPSKAALGSFSLMKSLGWDTGAVDHFAKGCQDDCLALVLVGWDGTVRGGFAFAENLRPEAVDTMAALEAQGLQCVVLTGDHHGRAERLAHRVGLPFIAGRLPEDKLSAIAAWQHNDAVVAMLGDGLNDAPSLSRADVGIAMGCGSDVTRDAADVCLLTTNLTLLPWSVKLARAVRRTVRRNLIWAVSYNVIGMAFAATGNLNPILAALAMVLSSGFVITDSLRLSAFPSPSASPSTSTSPSARDATRATLEPDMEVRKSLERGWVGGGAAG